MIEGESLLVLYPSQVMGVRSSIDLLFFTALIIDRATRSGVHPNLESMKFKILSAS